MPSPVQQAQEIYTAHLCLGKSNIIRDHTTGLHIQAMVLIEAARQMTISIIERYIYHGDESETYKMVWDSSKNEFKKYMLPAGIQIETKVEQIETVKKIHQIDFAINFTQNSEISATIHMRVICSPKRQILALEERNAKQIMNSILNEDVQYK